MAENSPPSLRILRERQFDRFERRHSKRSLRASTFLAGAVGAAFLVTAQSGTAYAGPEGASVVSGSVVIKGAGTKAVTIDQSTNRAIIDWRSFSIGVDESVKFQQPGAGSISLNRVTGGDPSKILGSLQSNGQVWLVNPAGVFFGSSATVDVAGLVATTSNISNENFLGGNYNFDVGTSDRGAVVINHGSISVADGGLAAFVAPGVGNTGSIVANMGRVALGSGDLFSFDLFGDGLVNLTATAADIGALETADGASLAARLVQDGQITADGGLVQLSVQSARSLVDNSINMSGVVRAQTVSEKGGSIILGGSDAGIVEITGTLDASGRGVGETGGSVKVLGDKIGLFEQTLIDASGDLGGGEILIGGNYLGGGPEQNATAVLFGGDVRVAADALTRGDGGRVIVWSDEYTNFQGAISTREASGGVGGFVETSSKMILVAGGNVDAGQGGTWLLDPNNITISNGADANIQGGTTFTSDGGGAGVVNVTTLQNALNAGTDVNILTTSGGGGRGDITVANAVTANMAGGDATLTLTAEGEISIAAGANIVATGAGELNIILNSNIAGTDAAGNVAIAANIDTNGGDLTIDTTTNKTSAFTIIQTGGTITAAAGNFTAGSGVITLDQGPNTFTGTVAAANVGGQDITIVAGGTLTTGVITAGGGGDISLTVEDIAITAAITGANITLTDNAGGIGFGDTNVVGGMNITGTEFQNINSSALTTLVTPGNVTVNGISAANSNNVTNLTIDAVGAITFATAKSTFNILTVESNVAVNANVGIETDVGALAIDADAENATTGLLTVAAGVTLTSAAGITLDATTQGITFTGAGTLNAVNGVTINDAVTATAGTLTIDADTDNDGTGTFTTIAAGTINSAGQTLDITAGDVSSRRCS